MIVEVVEILQPATVQVVEVAQAGQPTIVELLVPGLQGPPGDMHTSVDPKVWTQPVNIATTQGLPTTVLSADTHRHAALITNAGLYDARICFDGLNATGSHGLPFPAGSTYEFEPGDAPSGAVSVYADNSITVVAASLSGVDNYAPVVWTHGNVTVPTTTNTTLLTSANAPNGFLICNEGDNSIRVAADGIPASATHGLEIPAGGYLQADRSWSSTQNVTGYSVGGTNVSVGGF